jgi:hypothetical protein
MARKLTEDEAVLIHAVLSRDEEREIKGGKTVQVQFASDCGRVIVTVPGTVISFSRPDLETNPTFGEVQIVVSKATLRSVSQQLQPPEAHLPQPRSAFLTSTAVALGTLQQQHPDIPSGPLDLTPNQGDPSQ